jgi:hypothetical protein
MGWSDVVVLVKGRSRFKNEAWGSWCPNARPDASASPTWGLRPRFSARPVSFALCRAASLVAVVMFGFLPNRKAKRARSVCQPQAGTTLYVRPRQPVAIAALGLDRFDGGPPCRIGAVASPVLMERATFGRTKTHLVGGTGRAPKTFRPDRLKGSKLPGLVAGHGGGVASGARLH